MNESARTRAFFEFVAKRHAVYLARARGEPWPWTTDPILQTYRFCNIFRELDTVTRWIREHWREPFADHPNLWFMMCVARQINWPPTLAAIQETGFPDIWNPAAVVNVMRERQAAGEQVYTGAYMLRGPAGGGDKPFYTAYTVLDPVRRAGVALGSFNNPTLETWWRWLRLFHGWGPFLAYEVVTDLRHTRYLQDAPDINTWANAGPGAVRGLNRIYERPLASHQDPAAALTEMVYLLESQIRYLPGWMPVLELRDIEHSLCEFDKYERVRLGQGRPRAKFRPPEEP